MTARRDQPHGVRVFGLTDWSAWLDQKARAIYGMSAAEFEAAYAAGELGSSGVASDLASVLPLIKRLRFRDASSEDGTR